MAIRRYSRTPTIGFGSQYGTSRTIEVIRDAVDTGDVTSVVIISRDSDRLDVIAGRVYGNASLWWIIAAASQIGWALQVPPGTILRIPDINGIANLVG